LTYGFLRTISREQYHFGFFPVKDKVHLAADNGCRPVRSQGAYFEARWERVL
jgi:hypothetical protein